jgi:hypothetical protein
MRTGAKGRSACENMETERGAVRQEGERGRRRGRRRLTAEPCLGSPSPSADPPPVKAEETCAAVAAAAVAAVRGDAIERVWESGA